MSTKIKRPDIPIPEQMKSLPLTEGGYLKPWFVKAHDFRITDSDKAGLSVMKKACWICGNPFAVPKYAMVGDAMSATIRIYKEPPCHLECAEYAMQVCPFILYPNAKRRSSGLKYENTVEHINEGAAISLNADNPGEFYICVVTDFTYHHEHQVTAFDKDKILEIQHWIGGARQAAVVGPILSAEQVPDDLKGRL